MQAKTISFFALVGVLGVAGAAMMGATPVTVGTKAPNFSAKGSDGKTHTLASLTKSGPVVLYFISSSCPVNADAEKFYSRIAAAYGKDVKLVGVINENAAGFKVWQKEFNPKYNVLFDKDMKMIRAYKAEASPWSVLIKNGEVAKVWDGYSSKYLAEMNTSVAAAGKVAAKKIDLKGAPAEPAYG